MTSSRRNFLGLATMASVTALVAGCAAVQGSQNSQQAIAKVAQDVATLAAGYAAVLPKLQGATGIPAGTTAKIVAAIKNLQALSQQLASTASQSQAQSLISTVETDVNAVVDTAAGLPLPPPIGTIFEAGAVLLPVIEMTIGMVVPASQTAKAQLTGISPDMARAILTGAADQAKAR